MSASANKVCYHFCCHTHLPKKALVLIMNIESQCQPPFFVETAGTMYASRPLIKRSIRLMLRESITMMSMTWGWKTFHILGNNYFHPQSRVFDTTYFKKFFIV